MKTIQLTQAQRKAILDEVENWRDEDKIHFELELDGDLTITAEGWVTIDGYIENGYLNGTGAYVETYREANIELRGTLHEEDTSVEVYIDADLETECIKVLEELAA